MTQKKEIVIEKERSQFKKLLLQNPNYFGNLPEFKMEPVKKMAANKKYEEITCIGYNVDLDLLEATIQIKLPYGYKGDLCQSGSTEYVRFFIDYGDGWDDVGVVAFNAHDIPEYTDCAKKKTLPLSYVVTLPIEPKRKFCDTPVLPKVRAILSWASFPEPGNPNWVQTWGNTLTKHIQIKPLPKFVQCLEHHPALATSELIELPIDIASKLEHLKFKSMSFTGLLEKYGYSISSEEKKQTKAIVEPQRLGFAELRNVLVSGPINPKLVQAKMLEWKALGLDLSEAIAALEGITGNVSYEELVCLGLDLNREWMIATFHLKKPYGYSGDLCHKGSLEYLSFWADWDDNCKWEYLDTVSIRVHDIDEIPEDGLYYSVFIRTDMAPHKRTCKKPKIVRLRAVLSWNQPPSTTDPNEVPHWGNRKDVHIQIKPKSAGPEPTGPTISHLGGIEVLQIGVDGRTIPGTTFGFYGVEADLNGRSCPFGGKVIVNGPSILDAKYRVWVQKTTDIYPTLVANRIYTTPPGTWRYPDTEGYFSYLPNSQNAFDVLAYWYTSDNGPYDIWLEVKSPSQPLTIMSQKYRICFDNQKPEADISIDSGPCDLITQGTKITGRFVARDDHIGQFTLQTTPYPPHPKTFPGGVSTGTYMTSTAPGDKWTLKTDGMKPCGYVVTVRVWDRSIVGSRPSSHNHSSDDEGFCLLKKP